MFSSHFTRQGFRLRIAAAFIPVMLSGLSSRAEEGSMPERPAETRLDSLKANLPLLFIDMKEDLMRQDKQNAEKAAGEVAGESRIDEVVGDSIANMAVADSNRLKQLSQRAERNYADKLYLKNKAILDEARSKYFLTAYHDNYAYFGWIGDSSREGKYVGGRVALKFQISQKYPLFTTRYYTNGFYFAMSFRGLFDLFDGESSKPVTKKTFMPELFGKFDLGTLSRNFPGLLSEQSDKNTLQIGAQHESNGGYINSHPAFSSRSIAARVYAQYTYKFVKSESLEGLIGAYSNKFKGHVSVRVFSLQGVEENPDIGRYVGYSELRGGYESYLGGMWRIEGWMSPGDVFRSDFLPPSYALGLEYTPPWDRQEVKPKTRIPVTAYLRYFDGYNEFLETYNVRSRFLALGFKLRG